LGVSASGIEGLVAAAELRPNAALEERGASMRAFVFAAALAAVAAALAVPGPASARANTTLIATDGPGFTISMSQKVVKAGAYTIVVRDKSPIHNFHLIGPSVNKLTSVAAVATSTWKVILRKGTYRFVCDPHATTMKGVLRVT
jgi:plastocyanin